MVGQIRPCGIVIQVLYSKNLAYIFLQLHTNITNHYQVPEVPILNTITQGDLFFSEYS